LGANRKYELYNGCVILLNEEKSPLRTHGGGKSPVPTGELLFVKERISQEVANKAASRVFGLTAVVTKTRIQLSTTTKVGSWNDAEDLVHSFVNEVNNLLRSRDRTVALQRARKAGSREGYHYSPPGRN